MTFLYREFRTRFGVLSVMVEEQSQIVVRSGFLSIEMLLKDVPKIKKIKMNRSLFSVAENIENWLDGDLVALTRVNTRQAGSDFRQSCFRAMARIPAGKTLSYLELAAQSSSPKAIRAAASACSKNQVAPFVPCHRVVTAQGEIGNYAYGKPVKMALLAHEGWRGQA